MLNIIVGGFQIEMNGILVVNLVTSLGFGVEFCNHIAMNFMKQQGTREERAKRALAEMGSSVLVGITFTKFIGVIVLAFASSTLFKLYYFRMYLFIIILGAFNGLMVLPVLLSLIGPQSDVNEILDDYKHHKMVNMLIAKARNEKKYDRESNWYSLVDFNFKLKIQIYQFKNWIHIKQIFLEVGIIRTLSFSLNLQ